MTEAIKVGKPDIEPDTPAHTKGVKEGNELGAYRSQPGHKRGGKSTARRSTGIRARDRNPIVPGAPNISPA